MCPGAIEGDAIAGPLLYFVFDNHFIVTTNASNVAIGAITSIKGGHTDGSDIGSSMLENGNCATSRGSPWCIRGWN